MKKTFIAIAEIIGTIMGAGFLAIPYVAMKSGFPIALFNLIIICIMLSLVMLYLGEVTLRTKGNHQLPGYAEKYLGKKGKAIMLIVTLFGVFTALTAYLVAEGNSLSYLLFRTTDYTHYMSLAIWLVFALLSYSGTRALKKSESVGVLIMLALIISIVAIFFNKINIANLAYININSFFLPFGVILFSCLGFISVPEAKAILASEKKSLKKSIIYSYIIIFVIYAMFTAVVLGFKGNETPQIATLALGIPFIILGILTVSISYLALSISSIDMFRLDLKKGKKTSWFLTVIIPLAILIALQLLKQTSFTSIIGISGAISGGLTVILILLMVKKAKIKGEIKSEYSVPYSSILSIIIGLIFTAICVFEII